MTRALPLFFLLVASVLLWGAARLATSGVVG